LNFIVLVTEAVDISTKMEVFPTIHPQPRGSSRHASIEDLPLLKAVSVDPLEWMRDEIIRHGVLFGNKSPDIPRYLHEIALFAVSTKACAGAILAVVETVGIPVVLRPIAQKQGHFRFVSCAWMFTEPKEVLRDDGSLSDIWRPKLWRTLRQELMEVTLWHKFSPAEKEVFHIE
jgi:hypothetical protein